MPYYFFHWTPAIAEHLDEHGVTIDEFEAIVCNTSDPTKSRTSEREVAFGYGDDGRLLACVYDRLGDDIIPVTAYEPT